MRRIIKTVTIAGLLALAATASATPEAIIKIGWSGPLSGNSAVLGIDSVHAAQMVVDMVNHEGGINGKKLALIVEDDQYDTAKAVSAYSKLVSQGVVAILSSTYGGVFATSAKAVRDRVIVINPLDCNNDIAKLDENTFCVATESESIGRIIADDISKKQLAPVAVIYDEKNPFMVLVQSVLEKNLGSTSGSYFTGVDQGAADFRTVLTKARSKGIKSLVFLGHDPMGQAMREARSLGIKAQFYTLGTITSPGYQKLAGDSANGSLVAYWEAPRGDRYQQFLTEFQSKVGRPPILELASVPTYDAMAILADALRSASDSSGNVDIEAVKQNIYKLKSYAGLSGEISVDADGAVRTIRESIYTFTDGKLVK